MFLVVGRIVSYKFKLAKFWPFVVVGLNIVYVVLLSKIFSFSLVTDAVMMAFFWSIWTLFLGFTPFEGTKRQVIFLIAQDILAFCAVLVFMNIILTGPVRYTRNVIDLEPETETTFYCLTTDKYVSDSVIFDDGIVLSTEGGYTDSDKKNRVYSKIILIDGENDYIEKTEKHYYTEDRNINPPVRSYSRTEVLYTIYIGQDSFLTIDDD